MIPLPPETLQLDPSHPTLSAHLPVPFVSHHLHRLPVSRVSMVTRTRVLPEQCHPLQGCSLHATSPSSSWKMNHPSDLITVPGPGGAASCCRSDQCRIYYQSPPPLQVDAVLVSLWFPSPHRPCLSHLWIALGSSPWAQPGFCTGSSQVSCSLVAPMCVYFCLHYWNFLLFVFWPVFPPLECWLHGGAVALAMSSLRGWNE